MAFDRGTETHLQLPCPIWQNITTRFRRCGPAATGATATARGDMAVVATAGYVRQSTPCRREEACMELCSERIEVQTSQKLLPRSAERHRPHAGSSRRQNGNIRKGWPSNRTDIDIRTHFAHVNPEDKTETNQEIENSSFIHPSLQPWL